jgi:uncharacterized protein YbjT (DUF2867 family)
MRVFVAGASGVIGVRLVPLLVAAGNEVAGMTRSPVKLERLRELGAEPVLCDAFDSDALRQVVVAFQPEAVVNELTDLPDQPAATNEANARMRREGAPADSPWLISAFSIVSKSDSEVDDRWDESVYEPSQPKGMR